MSNIYGSLNKYYSAQFQYPSAFDKQALDDLFNVKAARAKTRSMDVFKNSKITDNGVIMNNDSVCKAVRNGSANDTSPDTVSWLSFQNDTMPADNHYFHVITLANFAQGSWHFPMELLVALASVDPDILAKSKIHVKSLHKRVNWLSLVGILKKDVIEGTVTGAVVADTVYAPQMGAYGQPTTSQLYWLRDIVRQKVNVSAIIRPLSSRQRRSIVLIQREKVNSRRLADFEVIKSTLQLLAKLLNFDFILHKEFTVFTDQFSLFANAAIVVAPHGAGGLFINFAPPDLCLLS